ncbi:MAG: hypothetical protein ACFFCS_09905 [Candidatus Hodarchaeota archaeon]
MPEVEEQFILKVLKEAGGEMKFKDLNEACAQEFEGARLFLKTMKGKKLVDYDGIIPSFDGMIKLLADE